MIPILVILICGALFAWGGYNYHNARRFFMPIILAVACLWRTEAWQAYTVLAMVPLLCLGDGPKSPLAHIFNQGWAKSAWGLLVCLGAALGLFCSGHIPLYWFLLYLLGGFGIYNLVKNWNQIVGDIIFGTWVGTVILIVK